MSPISLRALPAAERPRERLEQAGVEALSDIELLAMLLAPGSAGSSAIDIALSLLTAFGDLTALAEASCAELARISGMGPARAARLIASFALAARATSRPLLGHTLRTAADVDGWARPRLARSSKEHFVALVLDAKHRVRRTVEIAVGSLTGVEVHPRELFRELVRDAAAATLVVHNHPSGDPEPSQADLDLTARLREAGSLLGVPLLDHVIVGMGGYVSLAERGLL